MAASRILSRLSSRSIPSLAPPLKLHKNTLSPSLSPLKSTAPSLLPLPARRVTRLALSSLVSMLPLHSAIASARLQSVLSIESQSWGLVPQGVTWVMNDDT